MTEAKRPKAIYNPVADIPDDKVTLVKKHLICPSCKGNLHFENICGLNELLDINITSTNVHHVRHQAKPW